MALGNGAGTGVANTIQLGNSSITKVNTSGAFVSTNTTATSSTTTGALIISGGAGIGGALFVGGNYDITGSGNIRGLATFNNGITASGSATNTFNNLTVQNTSTLATTNISGITTISNATASTAINNGALIVTGGTGISGATNNHLRPHTSPERQNQGQGLCKTQHEIHLSFLYSSTAATHTNPAHRAFDPCGCVPWIRGLGGRVGCSRIRNH